MLGTSTAGNLVLGPPGSWFWPWAAGKLPATMWPALPSSPAGQTWLGRVGSPGRGILLLYPTEARWNLSHFLACDAAYRLM